MITGNGSASSPTLVLGPVDADYDLWIHGDGSDLLIGGDSSIGTGTDGFDIVNENGNPPVKLKLKVGDSLYVKGTYSFYATPR